MNTDNTDSEQPKPLTTEDTKEHGGKAASKKPCRLSTASRASQVNTHSEQSQNFNRRGRKDRREKIGRRISAAWFQYFVFLLLRFSLCAPLCPLWLKVLVLF
jgi:hypothetical protein